MLTESEFRELTIEFCEKINRFSDQIPWKLCEDDYGIYGRQSTSVEASDGEVYAKEVHIVYNTIYQVPVLWFNFFRKDGSPLPISDISKVLKTVRHEPQSSLLSRISHNEHPHLGVLYYNVHPCNTENLMNELNGTKCNFIMKWLSVYGPEIGINLPIEIYETGCEK